MLFCFFLQKSKKCVFIFLGPFSKKFSTLSTVSDHNFLLRSPRLRSEGLHLLHDIHAVSDVPEHYVLTVQVAGLGCAQEELAAVGVGPSVGHGEDTGSGVLQVEVLVLELVAVDRLASGAVLVGKVPTL